MRTKAILLLAALLASIPPSLPAQSSDRIRQQIRQFRESNEAGILAELRQLLAIPNVATDSVNIRRNASLLLEMLTRRGVRAQLLELEGSPPAVFGELVSPGATRTVVLYAHYDGQPVDSARWASSPWNPLLRSRALQQGGQEIPFPNPGQRVEPEARVYARSASDDKSPIVAMLAAIDALKAASVPLSVNLKFFFEGEEEAGSDHLREMLTRHADKLRADVWLFMDGPVHQSRRQQIVFGVRGVMGLNLTVYGPTRPLHSGHYGNWAPNPNVLLSHLIASLRDPEGRILIPGFYDDVREPSAAERAAFGTVPLIDAQLRRELGLARTEADNTPLLERLMLPALNVGGLSGGRTGAGGANLIGTEASAYIDFRLVPNQTPARVREQLTAFLKASGWFVVHQAPDSLARVTHPRIVRLAWSDSGYPANRTSLDLSVSRALMEAAGEALGRPVIQVPLLGGSLPLYHFREVLGATLITVPIVNHDNNQHGENENLRVQNLWDGIELIGGILAKLGQLWRTTT